MCILGMYCLWREIEHTAGFNLSVPRCRKTADILGKPRLEQFDFLQGMGWFGLITLPQILLHDVPATLYILNLCHFVVQGSGFLPSAAATSFHLWYNAALQIDDSTHIAGIHYGSVAPQGIIVLLSWIQMIARWHLAVVACFEACSF